MDTQQRRGFENDHNGTHAQGGLTGVCAPTTILGDSVCDQQTMIPKNATNISLGDNNSTIGISFTQRERERKITTPRIETSCWVEN